MVFTDVIKNPPSDAGGWDVINRAEHNLHHKWPSVVRQMHRMHDEKHARIDKLRQEHVDFPGYFAKQYVDQGLSRAEADVEVAADLVHLTTKTAHLASIVACCRVEDEIRNLLIADSRHPPEPTDLKTKDEPALSIETKTVTAIDGSITRDPIG